MKLVSLLAGAVMAVGLAGAASAQTPWPKAEYVAIPMEITVNKPVAEVWAKVGGWCDISKWIAPGREVPCVVTAGSGEVGSVRLIANAVTEVMVSKTQYGYGYAQPALEGKWYNTYHGFVEATPIDANSTKILYTLMLDVGNLATQEEKTKSVDGYKTRFNAALANMKKLAEG